VNVCVVGAGMVGVSTAWHLVRRGHSVVVLERSSVASGASGGLGERGVRANARDPAELLLARRALEMWPTLAAELGAPTGFRRTGHLQLIEREGDLASAEEIVRRQSAAGITCEVIGADELRAIEPDLGPSVIAAIRCPGDGVADHTSTTRAVAAAAQRAGAVLRERCEARLLADGGRLAVAADGERIDADAIVVAANAGAQELLSQAGVRLETVNVYPQVIVTSPLQGTVVRHLIGHSHRPLALKTLPDGAVMITGGRLGRDGAPRPGEVEANLTDASAVVPALAGVPVNVVADRAESVTGDLLPIVDRPADELVVAAGWSGHGWAIAPAVGELLADWIDTGVRPVVLEPFTAARFR